MQINPTSPPALEGKGTALSCLGNYDEAIIVEDQFLQTQPDKVSQVLTLTEKGSNLLHLKRFDEAIQSYDAALNQDPSNVEALIGKGAALAGGNRYNEAIASFDQALQIEPNNQRTFTLRALILRLVQCHEEPPSYRCS